MLLIYGGCVTPKETIKKELTLSLAEVLQRVRERHSFIRTLRGNGSITVESPQSSNSGSFDVDLKKPDSVRVELHGPFGLHVGTLSLSREQFIFYNRMENTAFIGKPDGRTLQSIFHLNMEFDELVWAFTGEYPLSIKGDSLKRFSVDEGAYIALYQSGGEQKEYRIDGNDFVVNNYRIIGPDGKMILNASASRPTTVDDRTMPTLLRVVFPVERRSVTIAYDEINLNGPVGCTFDLPDRVDRIFR